MEKTFTRELAFSNARRAGNVAENRFRRRHGLGGGEIINERRSEVGRGRVLVNLLRVRLVDGLVGIARGRRFVRPGQRRNYRHNENQRQTQIPALPRVDRFAVTREKELPQHGGLPEKNFKTKVAARHARREYVRPTSPKL